MKIAIITITRHGAGMGQQLRDNLPESRLYLTERYAAEAAPPFQTFQATELKTLLASSWKQYDAFICIMATGIVVRMIAPLLESKQSDPAVVVLDDGGHWAISLLSGHLGGANALAGQCATIIGGQAVVTTATDSNRLPSFDLLAQQQGWSIDTIRGVKILNRLLLDHGSIAVVDPTGCTRPPLQHLGNIRWYNSLNEAITDNAEGYLLVSNQQLPATELPANLLILRPRNLILGIGCNRGTPADEIERVVRTTLAQLALSHHSLRAVATATAKADEPGLCTFAERHCLPLLCFDREQLNSVACPSPPSSHALQAIGAKGVAEPAALLASHGGRLLLHKIKSGNVTLAVAETGSSIHP